MVPTFVACGHPNYHSDTSIYSRHHQRFTRSISGCQRHCESVKRREQRGRNNTPSIMVPPYPGQSGLQLSIKWLLLPPLKLPGVYSTYQNLILLLWNWYNATVSSPSERSTTGTTWRTLNISDSLSEKCGLVSLMSSPCSSSCTTVTHRQGLLVRVRNYTHHCLSFAKMKAQCLYSSWL